MEGIKEKIKKEAKKIMEDFINELGNIDIETDFELLREDYLREEGNGNEPDMEFREMFLNNAPKKSEGYILAEKGKWVTK